MQSGIMFSPWNPCLVLTLIAGTFLHKYLVTNIYISKGGCFYGRMKFGEDFIPNGFL